MSDQENIAPVKDEPVDHQEVVMKGVGIDRSNLFNVEILSIIKEAQSQHGLRHSHYQRYREYCSRRLKRLRKVLNFKMGDKKRVTPKKITEANFTDPRFVMMLVMSCERAWAMAMDLKQDDQTTPNPRKRHHMIERLRKARKIANELEDLCNNSERCNARTKLESQAYCAYINGVLDFELQKWTEARDNFTKTQTIYVKLAQTLSKEEHAVYDAMVQEIKPNVRYCAYTIGDQSAMEDLVQMKGTNRQVDPLLADKLDSLIAESREKQASTMSEVEWIGRTVRVKNNKVRLFLIGIKEFDSSVASVKDGEGRIELYENTLSECKDALQVTRDDIKSDPHSKTGGQVSDLQFLHSYLSYIRLTKMIERNQLIVEDMKAKAPELRLDSIGDGESPQQQQQHGKKQVRAVDLIRLYDVMLQHLHEVANLPGAENDEGIRSVIDVQQLAFKAYRCFYAAQAKVIDECWSEAMALYERVLVHARSAVDAYHLFTPRQVDIQPLQQLIETIAFNQYRLHARAVLNQVSKDEKPSVLDRTPLVSRLADYDELASASSTVTSSFPPAFEPVASKPIFFDLARDTIDFPSLDAKLRQGQQQQKRGIGGLLSNLWGGWGSK